ncbi:MAG: hypothetical protein ABEJ74_03175 [Haloferacaceae archaeon]
MAKVSVGLRGWRFEESEIFDGDGEYRPLDEMDEDDAERLQRLHYLIGEPCDACYLIHGEAEKRRCNEATIVYGEPMDEVLLCEAHEADFLYWFREAGGSDYRGDPAFNDAFHEWFDDGNRAPEGYGGLDHVDADPDALPEPPGPDEIQRRLNAEFEGREIDILEAAGEGKAEEREEADPLDEEDVSDVLGTDYPSK